MIDPKSYVTFVEQLEALMKQSHRLQLYRTQEKLHKALREARSEVVEVIPTNVPIIKFIIGPIEDQLKET